MRFTVQLTGNEIQPVDADSYVVDGETLIFLRSDDQLAAFFDMSVVVDWSPRLEHPTENRTRSVRRASGLVQTAFKTKMGSH
jgi:hypothetical protein